MKKDLVFGIDCDGVLRDSLKDMVRIYNAEIGDDMKVSDVKNFNVDVSFPRIYKETGIPAAEWFFDCHSEELFLNSKPIKGVQWAMRILREFGKVVIVTYQRSCENKLHTIEWLCRNKLMCDDVCFLKDKGLFRCDYFVDDNISNFEGSNSKNAVLISAPYNTDVKLYDEDGEEIKAEDSALAKIYKISNCENAMRFNSLKSFAEYINRTIPLTVNV